MSLPHAVIIAGGRGERLGGVRKADLRIGGRRLLDRVTDALGTVERPLLISIGRHAEWNDVPDGVLKLCDLDGLVGGPLAGLAAAIENLASRGVYEGLLVSVAVDTPFLPPDFVVRMCAQIQGATSAYAVWGDQFYPPNAVWRIEALASLPQHVVQNQAPSSLKALQRHLEAQAVDWTDHAKSDPFANLNTLGDLIALQRDRG